MKGDGCASIDAEMDALKKLGSSWKLESVQISPEKQIELDQLRRRRTRLYDVSYCAQQALQSLVIGQHIGDEGLLWIEAGVEKRHPDRPLLSRVEADTFFGDVAGYVSRYECCQLAQLLCPDDLLGQRLLFRGLDSIYYYLMMQGGGCGEDSHLDPLLEAAKHGIPCAVGAFAMLISEFDEQPECDQALPWPLVEQAANAGDALAMSVVGARLVRLGSPMGFVYLKRAAEMSNLNAMLLLSQYFLSGHEHLPKDLGLNAYYTIRSRCVIAQFRGLPFVPFAQQMVGVDFTNSEERRHVLFHLGRALYERVDWETGLYCSVREKQCERER
jgi:hypothetical protein